ncbi:MAG: YdiU family protein [Planctomycetota bacterium]|nr:YdiU family protein [Planctomycetota bacterium]
MTFQFDNSYARLPDAFHLPAEPTSVAAPMMIRLNRDLATELEIDIDQLDSPGGLEILSGNQLPEGAEPVAMAYSGHQFGGFSPQLGDGRAILLGEVISKTGIRYDIQLKGCGPTPFSRRGDGRSALGPVLREYLVSEAMAALGVPTTRALAAVATGENVIREGMEPGGVFTRVARSHVRIGTFQWFAARQDDENLKVLADYVIDRYYPHAGQAENPYQALLEEVIQQQANLIAHWMQLGFIHGVMNTDNMNISGETIDYGPCAFMDVYEPMKTFSSIDHQGRYAFGNQGPIGHWNLARFAETLLPLIDPELEKAVTVAEEALSAFPDVHQCALQKRFTAKIGIDDGDANDLEMAQRLLSTMADGQADFTQVFRYLPQSLQSGNDASVIGLFNQSAAIISWLDDWRARVSPLDRDETLSLMRRSNPVFIPRNHRIEEAIEAAHAGNFEPFHTLHQVLQHPFREQREHSEYEAPPTPEEVVQATFCGT